MMIMLSLACSLGKAERETVKDIKDIIIQVIIDYWRNNLSNAESYKHKANHYQKELNVEHELAALDVNELINLDISLR